MIAGWQIYSYVATPYFDSSGNKKAYGSVPAAGDRKGSVFFSVGNVKKKTGLTKQYFNPAVNDPESQTNKLNYRHYFIAIPVRSKYIGASY
jgi:hypothetical protein